MLTVYAGSGERENMKKNQTALDSLRTRAVKRPCEKQVPGINISTRDPEKLLEELHINQIELEMQNEDLRTVQGELEKTRAKYIDLFEFSPVGYFTLGTNGKILEVNLTAARLLGLDKSQILNRPLTDFADSESQDTLYFYLEKLAQSESRESCCLKLRRHDEKSFFAHFDGITVLNGSNAANEIRISFVDVHKEKMNEIALKETAERNELLLNLLPQSAILIDIKRKVLAANRMAKKAGAKVGEVLIHEDLPGNDDLKQTPAEVVGFAKPGDAPCIACLPEENSHKQRLITVIEDSNDAVSLVDMQGNIMTWNRRAEEMYGYPAVDANRMSIFDLVPPELKQSTRQLLSDIRAGILIKPFETRRIAKDGSVLDICMTVTRIVQGGKIFAIASTERDITDHNLWFASIKALPKRIIMAQEKERSRISQILHSDFGQSLIALKLFTVMSASGLPGGETRIKRVFNKIRTQLDKIINDARNLSHELSPPGLRYVGLVPAIKDLVESAMQRKNLEIRFFHRNMERPNFTKQKVIIIYRILQEALQNIFKHSQATKASVTAVFKNSKFALEISDNGNGFDPSLKAISRGLGLALMKEQASLINATLSVESRPGRGTSIRVTLPIKEKKKV